MRRDLGDFQTPSELVAAVLETLGPISLRWRRVLEPTCGQGSFIAGLLALRVPPREILGIEIQEDHCQAARALPAEKGSSRVEVTIVHGDFFGLDLKEDLSWRETGPLLVVGNPPWVTTAELGRSATNWQPPKRNIKGLPGLAARTGASNFDVAEAVWLKLIHELADQSPTIALLCKTAVARRVLQYAHRARLPLSAASIRRIDAARWFGAAVEACLFRMTLGTTNRCREIPVFADLSQAEPESVLGFERGWLIADRAAYEPWAFADGKCPLSWRQGLKHDAAAVMELVRDHESGELKNGSGESVDVEPRMSILSRKDEIWRPPRGNHRSGRCFSPRNGSARIPRASPNRRRASSATCKRTPRRLRCADRRFIAGSRRLLCLASVRTASHRSRWPSAAYTKNRASRRSGRLAGDR